MNIQKVSKTASIVNYIKPELEMVEMETEGVLCTSTPPSNVTISGRPNSFAGGSQNTLNVTRRSN
jgi:hypothetical protein